MADLSGHKPQPGNTLSSVSAPAMWGTNPFGDAAIGTALETSPTIERWQHLYGLAASACIEQAMQPATDLMSFATENLQPTSNHMIYACKLYGQICFSHGRHQEAEQAFDSAITGLEEQDPGNNQEPIGIFKRLKAVCLAQQNNPKAAMATAEESYKMINPLVTGERSSSKSLQLEYAKLLDQQGDLFVMIGACEHAAVKFQEASVVWHRFDPKNITRHALSAFRVGQTEVASGLYEQGQANLEQAVGLNHAVLQNLDVQGTDPGNRAFHQHRVFKARALYQLTEVTFKLGDTHVFGDHRQTFLELAKIVGLSYYPSALSLGGISALSKGDLERAEGFIDSALKANREIFQAPNPGQVGLLSNWATVCERQRNVVGAIQAMENAYKLVGRFPAVLGGYRNPVLEKLLALHGNQGNSERAQELRYEFFSILSEQPESSETEQSMGKLVRDQIESCRERRDLEQAIALAEDLRDEFANAQNPEGILLHLEGLSLLVSCSNDKGEHEKAIAYAEEALTKAEAIKDTHRSDYRACQDKLLLAKMFFGDKVALLELQKLYAEENHPPYLQKAWLSSIATNFGNYFFNQKDYKQALKYYQEALELNDEEAHSYLIRRAKLILNIVEARTDLVKAKDLSVEDFEGTSPLFDLTEAEEILEELGGNDTLLAEVFLARVQALRTLDRGVEADLLRAEIERRFFNNEQSESN